MNPGSCVESVSKSGDGIFGKSYSRVRRERTDIAYSPWVHKIKISVKEWRQFTRKLLSFRFLKVCRVEGNLVMDDWSGICFVGQQLILAWSVEELDCDCSWLLFNEILQSVWRPQQQNSYLMIDVRLEQSNNTIVTHN